MTKKILQILLAAAALAAASSARATTIEGYTPSGNFQTVGVSDLGAMFVDILSTTPQHVTTDPGSVVGITSVTATVPIKGVAGAEPVPISGTVSVISTVTVVASSATVPASAVFSLNGATAVQILSADAARMQSIIRNTDPSMTAWIGPAGVTRSNGMPLLAGETMTPDVPASFRGALFAVSSTTAQGQVTTLTFK